MQGPFERTERLSELIQTKLAVLLRLRELGQLLSAQSAATDADALVAMLARKQPLMDELAKIQNDLVEFAGDDPDARQWASRSNREKCRADSDKCQQVLREILIFEKQAIDELSARREVIADQLQDGRDFMQARTAYLSNSPTTLDGSLDLSNS